MNGPCVNYPSLTDYEASSGNDMTSFCYTGLFPNLFSDFVKGFNK